MNYPLIITGIISYLLGGITFFIFYNKNILHDTFIYNSFTKNNKGILNKLWYQFYDGLSSSVDLSKFGDSVELLEIERKRIGMNVHDEIAGQISSLYLDLQVISDESHTMSPHAEKKIMDMKSKVKNTTEAIRRIIYGLVPTTLEMRNLEEALVELCRKKDNTVKGTSVLFRSQGQRVELRPDHELYLYRIVQELINNSLKHSEAWHIFVTLLWSETELKLIVRDNGNGLPVRFYDKKEGHGIKEIFVRTTVIGAISKFNSASKGGTEFTLTLPLENSRANRSAESIY